MSRGLGDVYKRQDHKVTAAAIAKRIGILKEESEACEGSQIDRMSDEELKDFVEGISVYARVSPEHKIRIVRAWQEKGNIVSMTGDGVNDAPALKQADVGVAMGITGSEVSKDAAAMILTDDNFATIVKAVENGRNLYRNIKFAIQFLLSGNFGAILAVLVASIFALPVPFAPVVITKGASNALKEPVMERITFNVIIVLILGRIMCLNCSHLFAPSRDAAS